MKVFIQKLIGKVNYIKLEAFKKKYWPTAYDKQQLNFFKDQVTFYNQFIQPGDLCFDIGANIGFKTNIFLTLNARVVALEPQESCITYLKARYGKKATILQKGAGAENTIEDFYRSSDSQVSSFTKGWVDEFKDSRFAGSEIEKVEQVELVTLDSLVNLYGYPAFIKIDVEGYEIEVIKGLSKPFGSLSFEYAVPEKLNEVMDCLKELAGKYNDLICNYATCNESNLALDQWLPINDMITYVQAPYFSNTFAGDIYIKSYNL